MAHYFQNLVTELITPFNDDGSVDHETLAGIVDFQIKNGVRHFFVNGLGGESHLLSFQERQDVLRTVSSRCTDGAKTMACVFVSTVQEGKELMDMYADVKHDAICLTAPAFFPYNEQALYTFTSELLEYAKEPSYIYNCVQMGTLYSPELLTRLWKDHSNLYGYKNATRDIVHYMQCLMRIDATKFDFLDGCDATIAPTMLVGGVGCVSFMGVPFPKETKAICDYALAGNTEKAMQAQYRILELRNILKKSPFNAAYMLAMELTGGPVARNTRMVPEMALVSDAVRKELFETYARHQAEPLE
ncbi:MAG TPA: dihydrodipicolinate synthase family protein [Anaerolineaceae bacterium]|jgi:Dihydrodipicolinate synthase/N-acetylneuraminate lyase|nr:dihydrodipicolinate synthase family protein [Anaerolineales bacterium]HPY33530.1 dihydrodipicolinate synthase family protein [Anaerolineaceae bacterium]HQC21132.1 dihydrodipicolinate synthase family protein [Anaerolineaceae bacterium]